VAVDEDRKKASLKLLTLNHLIRRFDFVSDVTAPQFIEEHKRLPQVSLFTNPSNCYEAAAAICGGSTENDGTQIAKM